MQVLSLNGDFSSRYEKCICNYKASTSIASPLSLRQLSHCLKSEIKPQQRDLEALDANAYKKAEAQLNGAAASAKLLARRLKSKKLMRDSVLCVFAAIILYNTPCRHNSNLP